MKLAASSSSSSYLASFTDFGTSCRATQIRNATPIQSSDHQALRYACNCVVSAHCNLFSSADTVLAAIQIPPPLAAAFLPWRVGSDRVGSRVRRRRRTRTALVVVE